MTKLTSRYGASLILPGVFILLFIVSAYFYAQHSLELATRQFKHHAQVLADDVWALNQYGAKAYLQLAVKANHYKSLRISIPGESNYLQVKSPPLDGLSRILYNAQLIRTAELQESIYHQGDVIGTLHGERYIRIIFPLANLLVFLLLVYIATTFLIHLARNRQALEQQVKERTKNLRASERRFHDLVNLLPEMVLETDRDGTIIYANRAANEHLPVTWDKADPTNFLDLVVEEERDVARHEFHLSLQGDKSDLKEFTLVNREQETIPVLIRLAAIVTDSEVVGSRMIVVDISERRRLEEQLHRDQKMKAIGLMAGGVAHDLNNILSGIVSYPELLLMDIDEDSPMHRPLEEIRRSGLEASEVVADLLTVARGIAPMRETAALNTLIRDYLNSPDYRQLLRQYPKIKVVTSFDNKLKNISCSPIHVRKCLMNLVTNGMEAMQDRGTLSVITSNYEQLSEAVEDGNNLATGYYATITIRDTGSGISEKELSQIFEPFFTKKVMGRSGTGLGLAVVWNIMRDHGGQVKAVSSPTGTSFTLFFPCLESDHLALHTTTATQRHKYRGNGQTVLVVDDEKRQRDIAREILRSLNYQVETVGSGEEAIAYLRQQDTDLLVLDMIMPLGLNGRQTYEKILQFRPLQKAIIASGFAEDDDVKATQALGAGRFVAKPYTVEQLSLAVHKTLMG